MHKMLKDFHLFWRLRLCWKSLSNPLSPYPRPSNRSHQRSWHKHRHFRDTWCVKDRQRHIPYISSSGGYVYHSSYDYLFIKTFWVRFSWFSTAQRGIIRANDNPVPYVLHFWAHQIYLPEFSSELAAIILAKNTKRHHISARNGNMNWKYVNYEYKASWSTKQLKGQPTILLIKAWLANTFLR